MMKRFVTLALLAATLLPALSTTAWGQSKALILSAGVGTGDYHNSFVAGLSGDFRLVPFVHGEAEFFYYRMPGPRATTAGEAITSTALDLNFALLFQPDIRDLRFIPYAGFTGGRLYESETWKFSATKTVMHHSYTRWDVGPAAGLKIILSKSSGLRLDFRWIRVLNKNHQVPRYTLGYMLLI